MRQRSLTRYLVVHCSATGPQQDIGVATIRLWHRAKGWSDVGYHFVIRLDGRLETGRPETVTGAHVEGHNHHSIGICLVGGLDAGARPAATFATPQLTALRSLLVRLRDRFPGAIIRGHRDFPGVAKACPCFDVDRWWTTGVIA